MKFKEWILHFKHVNRPIGDLAKDIARDPTFPNENDQEIIRKYLIEKASPIILLEIIKTFDNAWEYYQKDI